MTMLPVFIAASIIRSRRGEEDRVRDAAHRDAPISRPRGWADAPREPSLVELVNEHSAHIRPDLIGICARVGITVETKALRADLAGYVDEPTKRFVLNSETTAMRQRWTLAHQMAHWIWHRKALAAYGGTNDGTDCRGIVNAPRYNPDISEKDEIFANKIAINLLMSAPVVRGLHETGLDARGIAKRLGTSKKAIEIRLETLGLVPNLTTADMPAAA